MPDRAETISTFLASAGWGDAAIAPLAGDASNRRYLRLSRDSAPFRAVLMDAPAEKGEDTRSFTHIARFLTGAGLSAPRIYADDPEQGLMLLEDLGDALFARVIPKTPACEAELYAAATDVLVHLHRTPPPPGLSPYSAELMTDLAALAFDWYLDGQNGPAEAAFRDRMRAALLRHAPEQEVLIQRDYHSENLLWLPERVGIARVGLLDFQDAMLGHRAYDLVSLLQDARRDVPAEIEADMLSRYIKATGANAENFTAAYHVLGAQRNLRIVGVFARLCLRDGKPYYVDLIPRVWDLLQRDLAHPALLEVAEIVADALPVPDRALLTKLKDRCATLPAQ